MPLRPRDLRHKAQLYLLLLQAVVHVLESALRRAEILTYTVIGLGLAILAYLIIISLLNT